VSSIRRQCWLLVPQRLVRSSYHLSMGHSLQLYYAHSSLPLRFYQTDRFDQLRQGLPRYHHLLRLLRYTRTDFIFYHCRDIVGPSSCFEHWCLSCRLLCRRDSYDLSSLEDAKPDRMKPRRQVRLHLGRSTSSFLSSSIALTAKFTSCSTVRSTLVSSRRLSLTLGTTSKLSRRYKWERCTSRASAA
jgi:hypothetical protein